MQTNLLISADYFTCTSPQLFFFNWDSKKKKHKRLKHTRNLFRKNLQLKGVC